MLLAARWVANWTAADVAAFARGGWVIEVGVVSTAAAAATVTLTLPTGSVTGGPGGSLPLAIAASASVVYMPPTRVLASSVNASAGAWFTVVVAAANQGAAVPPISNAAAVARAASGGVSISVADLVDDALLNLTLPSAADAGLNASGGGAALQVVGVRPAAYATASLTADGVAAARSRPAASGYAFDVMLLGLPVAAADTTVTVMLPAATLLEPGAGAWPGTRGAQSPTSPINRLPLVLRFPASPPLPPFAASATYFIATVNIGGVTLATIGGGAGVASIAASIAAALGIDPLRVVVTGLAQIAAPAAGRRRLDGGQPAEDGGALRRSLADSSGVAATVNVGGGRGKAAGQAAAASAG